MQEPSTRVGDTRRSEAPPPAERWFKGHGIRIHGLDWGDRSAGTPILFLHGVGGNAWVWDDVAPRLAASLPRHHLVAIDQRDGGDTDHPATAYDRADFIADIVAVHDQLGGGPMILVGHSRGGWLGTAFAIEHPDRVAGLVLVDPARLAFATDTDSESFYRWVRDALGPFESEEAALAWAKREDPDAVWTEVRTRSLLFGYRTAADGRLVGKLPSSAVDRLRAARAGAEGVTTALATMTRPVLLLVSERQSAARIADKLAYADRLPQVRAVRIDGTHFLHTDAPGAVSAAIVRFVTDEC